MCPITSKAKGYPFEVALPSALRVSGVILSDHVKNLDWRARRSSFIARAPSRVVDEVRAKLMALLR